MQMLNQRIYIYSALVFIITLSWMFIDKLEGSELEAERTKISMREVGNQLLLGDQDSTSLILPIFKESNSKYTLAFEKSLSFEPNDLVSIIEQNFILSELPSNYLVEVIRCSDGEVAYSYQMTASIENTIIPCVGRRLPRGCYSIEVTFTHAASRSYQSFLIFLTALVLILICLYEIKYRIKNKAQKTNKRLETYASIGSFQFYPEQNKLVKAAMEINLSKKECELLAIFVAHPNEIVKRDTLTKKVWEDNGVFVGRSLDTYISKLRKKIKGRRFYKIDKCSWRWL